MHKLGSGRSGAESSDLFPQHAGSHLKLHNPALEFVKAICHVLSLDPNIRHQVAKLRYVQLPWHLCDLSFFIGSENFVIFEVWGTYFGVGL